MTSYLFNDIFCLGYNLTQAKNQAFWKCGLDQLKTLEMKSYQLTTELMTLSLMAW